jgi:hypothetical protein
LDDPGSNSIAASRWALRFSTLFSNLEDIDKFIAVELDFRYVDDVVGREKSSSSSTRSDANA